MSRFFVYLRAENIKGGACGTSYLQVSSAGTAVDESQKCQLSPSPYMSYVATAFGLSIL